MATKRTVQFEVCGEGARALADALRDEIKKLLPEYEVQALEHATPRRRAERGVDPVAVAALAVSLPSALVATLTLADRMQLKSKVDVLVAWAKRRRATGGRISWSREGGRAKPLDEAKTAEIVQALYELAERSKRGRS